jgi:GNAT superfamily N-acetyltransferase
MTVCVFNHMPAACGRLHNTWAQSRTIAWLSMCKDFIKHMPAAVEPPCLQQCAYLCNMAVAKQWQRRGIASQLMVAVEDLCLLAGECR